jgi:hypothetical protein
MTSRPSKFLSQMKTRTEPGESVVLQDFAKNYYFTSEKKLEYQ